MATNLLYRTALAYIWSISRDIIKSVGTKTRVT